MDKSMYEAWLEAGPETDALIKTLRDIPQSERDKMPAEDFAGPNRSFPIQKPEDVAAAAHSLGRAKGNRDAIKRRIISIAYRKGAAYVAHLPEAWKRGAKSKAASGARQLQLRGCVGKIRTAKFRGRDHVVVPITMLVEGVIHPSNVEEPEFVPASSFSTAPQGWNGRPVMLSHPKDGDEPVSANSPEVLEAAMGTLFNTHVAGDRLLTEAWIDRELTAAAGAKAVRALERIEAQDPADPVEVSVGAFVTTLEEAGTFRGKRYARVWQDITQDHLAILEEGDRGACSVAMGCGVARVHTLSAKGLEFEGDDAPEEPRAKSLRERLLAWMRGLDSSMGMSDTDVRQELMDALKAADPNARWIDAVYDEYVVYCQASPVPDGYGGFTTGSKYMQQGYSIDSAGVVTLTGDPVEVEPVMSYEPVTAANRNSNEGDEDMKTKAERIKALIANPRAKFTEADRAMLEAATDDRLAAFEAAAGECPCKAKIDKILANKRLPFTEADRPALEAMTEERLTALAAMPSEEPETPAQKKAREDAAAAAAGGQPTPLTEEQYLAQAPQSVRDLVSRQKAADAARRTELVKTLKAAQGEYTEAELTAMPLEQLERLARATKAAVPEVDYSLRAPRAAGQNQGAAPKPPDLNARIRAARGVAN